jgi:uncharacterized membrane protein/peptidoglycan/xylan/chitin deacetylase (PgdA/CDA1 family)
MTAAPTPTGSRAFRAGIAALALAAAAAPLWPAAAAAPLALFIGACLAAPFFPGWGFFLPTHPRGPRAGRRVAITFDDGPAPATLGPLLALLAREGVRATFFLVGRRVEEYPAAVGEILAAGHTVGNHSWSHDPLLMLRSLRRLEDDVRACQELLARHGAAPFLFRPPAGITNPRLPIVLRRLGLTCVTFRVRPLDFGNTRLERLPARVLGRVGPGDLVVLHDSSPGPERLGAWLDAVAQVVRGLRASGLEIVPLETLLGRPVMRPAVAAAEPAGTPAAATPPARPRVGAIALGVLSAVLVLGYPLLAWLGMAVMGTRSAALVLLAAFALSQLRRVAGRPAALRGLASLGVAVLGLLGLAALLDDPRFILAYPSLVNLVLLVQFGWSLRAGPPMVERFARLQVDDLSPAELAYCRTVTRVWCGFFLLNGATSAGLAALGPRSAWALYSGVLSYVLMGLLFAVEYVVRKARFGRFGPGLVDRSLARLVGPSSTR